MATGGWFGRRHRSRWAAAGALVVAAACGGDEPADRATDTTTTATVTSTTVTPATVTPATTVTPPSEPRPSTTSTASPTTTGEVGDAGSLPETEAPGGLATATLPTTDQGVVDLLGALPTELFGARRDVTAPAPGRFGADYRLDDRQCGQPGLTALDVSAPGGFFPEGTTADEVVEMLANSDDPEVEVEATGRDGDIAWMTMTTTCSGFGVDGVQPVSTAGWARVGGDWAFFASAADASERDRMLSVFAAAADSLADDQSAPMTDEQAAAEAALLTLDDLGDGWLSRPRLPDDGAVSDELAMEVFAAEPACADSIAFFDDLGVASMSDVGELLLGEPLARAESRTFLLASDYFSEIEHTVSLFDSADAVAESFAAARRHGFPTCVAAVFDDLMEAILRDTAPGELTISDVEAAELPVTPDGFGVRVAMTFDVGGAGGLAVTMSLTVTALGPVTSAVTTFSVDPELDARMDDIVAAATAKVEASVAATP